jgi:hypothetical protein
VCTTSMCAAVYVACSCDVVRAGLVSPDSHEETCGAHTDPSPAISSPSGPFSSPHQCASLIISVSACVCYSRDTGLGAWCCGCFALGQIANKIQWRWR